MKKLLLSLIFAVLPVASSLAQQRIAIVNVTVIDGTDHPPMPNTTVFVQDGKIRTITNTGATTGRCYYHRRNWKISDPRPLEQRPA